MAQRQREDKVQPIDKYGASVFYGAGPQQAPQSQFGSYGATYSNGQARPVVSPPSGAPAGVRPISPNLVEAGGLRNENWRQDQIILSSETQEFHNGSSSSRPNQPSASLFNGGRGDASGPEYSIEFRRTLDALLNGRASLL